MKSRDKLRVKAIKSKSSQDWKRLNDARSKARQNIRLSHRSYVPEIVAASLNDSPRSIWSYIRALHRDETGIPTLRTNTGLPATSDCAKSNVPNVSIPMLTSIVNKSWAKKKVPQEWRVVDIIPMPNVEMNLQKMKSYRPMSLTVTIGKTMEYLVTNRLQYFAESMHLLTEYKAGFTNGRNTEDQLLRLSQSISDVFQQSPT